MLLVTLCNERERTYVVVDALDECDAIHERRLLLPLLESLPYGSTRLFVTSRPNHEDICHVFEKVSQIKITAPEPEIKRFVTEKMEEKGIHRTSDAGTKKANYFNNLRTSIRDVSRP